MLAKVYINLLDQKEPTLDFQSKNNDQIELATNKTSYFKKIVKPTKKELKLHFEFFSKNLRKNFFN